MAFQGRDERSRAVSDELQQIFGEAAPAAEPAAVRPSAVKGVPLGRPRRRLSPGLAGGLAAVALVGVAAMALADRAPREAAPARTLPVQVAAATPAPAPQPARPVAPAAAQLASLPTPAPAAQPEPAVQKAVARAKPRAERPKVVRTKSSASSSRGGRCAGLGGEARARCLYPAVIRADRRLRSAYASAVRAGAPRAVLVEYRREWAGLRRAANRDPGRVIAGYQAMASELDRLAARS